MPARLLERRADTEAENAARRDGETRNSMCERGIDRDSCKGSVEGTKRAGTGPDVGDE